MAGRRAESEAYMRRVAAEIRQARAEGAESPEDLARALNARGVTSRKGRPWTPASLARFLESPGARRHGVGAAAPPLRGP